MTPAQRAAQAARARARVAAWVRRHVVDVEPEAPGHDTRTALDKRDAQRRGA